MREVRVYDGDFPTWQQMLAGGPGAAFPKEVWLQKVQPGEFAVRYKDFKTGLSRNPSGELAKSSEICRIFDNLDEARADSRKVVNESWVVHCFIYDHTGNQVDTISNAKQLNKFAFVVYGQVLLTVAFCALVGMALMWIIYKIWQFISPSTPSAHVPPVFGWLYWVSYVAAGLLLLALVIYLRFRWGVHRTVSRMRTKLNSAISPEEKKRFEELNTLYLSRDPADCERCLKLSNEYEEKIRKALKR
jgi:hypothetical protein